MKKKNILQKLDKNFANKLENLFGRRSGTSQQKKQPPNSKKKIIKKNIPIVKKEVPIVKKEVPIESVKEIQTIKKKNDNSKLNVGNDINKLLLDFNKILLEKEITKKKNSDYITIHKKSISLIILVTFFMTNITTSWLRSFF